MTVVDIALEFLVMGCVFAAVQHRFRIDMFKLAHFVCGEVVFFVVHLIGFTFTLMLSCFMVWWGLDNFEFSFDWVK